MHSHQQRDGPKNAQTKGEDPRKVKRLRCSRSPILHLPHEWKNVCTERLVWRSIFQQLLYLGAANHIETSPAFLHTMPRALPNSKKGGGGAGDGWPYSQSFLGWW